MAARLANVPPCSVRRLALAPPVEMPATPSERVSDSCGFGVPKYEYVRQRRGLTTWADSKGTAGLAQYREEKNSKSIDGQEITMPSPSPFVREAGSGPGVVCIHSNASSSAQWRGLMDLLSRSHRVLAPDSYGCGKSPDWHSDRKITLRDEVDLIEPVFTSAGTLFALASQPSLGPGTP